MSLSRIFFDTVEESVGINERKSSFTFNNFGGPWVKINSLMFGYIVSKSSVEALLHTLSLYAYISVGIDCLS